MSEVAPAHTEAVAGPPPQDESVLQVLAAKVLTDWLRNRQQLLVPLRLDVQKLDPLQSALVIEAMAAAAQADGALDDAKRERLETALQFVNAGERERDALSRALEHPRALRDVLKQIADVQTGAIFHAASLLAIDRRRRVNRYYLRYLAARLELSRDLTRDLERRFGAAT